MKKIFLTLLIIFSFSNIASAEWIKIADDGSGTGTGVVVYYDSAIIKHGNIVKIWVMYDNVTVAPINGYTIKSMVGLNEYDCTERRSRSLQGTLFSENMGSGYVDSSNEVSSWEYPRPGTIYAREMDIACK